MKSCAKWHGVKDDDRVAFIASKLSGPVCVVSRNHYQGGPIRAELFQGLKDKLIHPVGAVRGRIRGRSGAYAKRQPTCPVVREGLPHSQPFCRHEPVSPDNRGRILVRRHSRPHMVATQPKAGPASMSRNDDPTRGIELGAMATAMTGSSRTDPRPGASGSGSESTTRLRSDVCTR